MNDKKLPHLRPVMFAGTGSDAGKSVIAAAFCRIFKQDGYNPAPFKAQNMALNSFVTPEGLELGRAQAVQAEAAGVDCHTDMNPLLLKPSGDCMAQVVLNGRPIGNRSARDYFSKQGREGLVCEVNAAFDRLAKRYNPVVMEGAGSISELNLKEVDLVNMPMARHADASIILVADIDKGGVFANTYGSIMLQAEEDRHRIKGILVNKFRGDISLFKDGVKMIEDLCAVPVVGVVPYYKDIYIEDEDSLALQTKGLTAVSGKINIAVVLLRHLSNFTDFNVLERDERVHLFYTNNTEELQKADIIILPGSKNTLNDLCELRRNGVAQAILQAHHKGSSVMGICGGYQMMGKEIRDPDHVEGEIESLPGLGLLPVTTRMKKEKTTRRVTFRMALSEKHCDIPCHGYEIHMGETKILPGAEGRAFTYLTGERSGENYNSDAFDASKNGYFLNSCCMGTYIHGILDNPSVIDFLLRPFLDKTSSQTTFDYAAFKEVQYDKLASHVRQNVNMKLIYDIVAP